jgi:hypothetical protein
MSEAMILTGLSNPKACIQIIHGFFILCDTFFTSSSFRD